MPITDKDALALAELDNYRRALTDARPPTEALEAEDDESTGEAE